jgi:hypothetical protein
MIAYDWVGQAQALAVREFAQRLSIRSKVTIVARAEYTNEESPSGRLHVFLVPYSRDGEEERRAYVSGIEAGLLAWRNPIYSILILVAVPLGIIVGYRLLKLKGQIPTNIAHVLVVGLAVAFPVYKDLVPVQIALVLSSILAGKALRDNLDRKA